MHHTGKLLALIFILIAVKAQGQTIDQAERWLRHLYRFYEYPPTPLGPDLLSKHPLQVYTPSLYALVRRDQRRAGPGDVGHLDIDPICICQDNDGMKLTHLDVVKTGPSSATANIELHYPEPQTIHARLLLQWTPNGWRVDDVSSDDLPSLRKLLR